MGAPSPTQRNVKWVEGLRGVASLLVVTSHLCRAFCDTLLYPQATENERGSIFHLPYLRLFAQGSPWVALFFLLTGFVNAMSPIKKAHDGNVQQALPGLASSAFRRTFRLVLPTTIACVFAWFLCQLGLYALSAHCDAFWMRNTSPLPDPTFREAIYNLVKYCFLTWKKGENKYEKNQWSLPFLLKGSMLVYLVLLATIRCTPKWRMTVMFALYSYSWAIGDAMVGMNIYSGALLAELNMYIGIAATTATTATDPSKPRPLTRTLAILFLILGLHFCGFPESKYEWASWSRNLHHIGSLLFPAGAEMYRFWPSLGVQLVTLAIMLFPPLQRVLSSRPLLWLGGASFPIYLIHGPIIRTVLAWLLFGLREPVLQYEHNEDGSVSSEHEVLPMPAAWMYVLALPVFFAILFACAHAWNLWVEPLCAQWTKRAEEIMTGAGEAEVRSTDKEGRGLMNGTLPH